MSGERKETSRADRPATPHQVDLSRASFGAHTPSADIAQSTEIELKFFIPDDILRPLIRGREHFQLQQHYFPKESVAQLKREFSLPLLVENSDEFKVARVRETRIPDGSIHYLLEFKGPKGEISRREFGISINRATYRTLLDRATAGTVQKKRYEIPGAIHHKGRDIISVAQVDVVLRAGIQAEPLTQTLATIDIELATHDLAEALLAGKHTFDFLRNCVPLFGEGADIGKNIATRKLAKRGLDGDAKEALKELKVAAKKLRN